MTASSPKFALQEHSKPSIGMSLLLGEHHEDSRCLGILLPETPFSLLLIWSHQPLVGFFPRGQAWKAREYSTGFERTIETSHPYNYLPPVQDHCVP
jgi:hypothetical protein